MFSAGARVFSPEREFFFAEAGAGGGKPGVCAALLKLFKEQNTNAQAFFVSARDNKKKFQRLITNCEFFFNFFFSFLLLLFLKAKVRARVRVWG